MWDSFHYIFSSQIEPLSECSGRTIIRKIIQNLDSGWHILSTISMKRLHKSRVKIEDHTTAVVKVEFVWNVINLKSSMLNSSIRFITSDWCLLSRVLWIIYVVQQNHLIKNILNISTFINKLFSNPNWNNYLHT